MKGVIAVGVGEACGSAGLGRDREAGRRECCVLFREVVVGGEGGS
jgi:hypothetical protein